MVHFSVISIGFVKFAQIDGQVNFIVIAWHTGNSELKVLENTLQLHNVAVCTLCSCYPRALLGRPPAWYKAKEYRSRLVQEPRSILTEIGTVIADNVEVRVHDSTAELRYLVLPLRPESSEGMDLTELAGLVSRDGMIGVAAL